MYIRAYLSNHVIVLIINWLYQHDIGLNIFQLTSSSLYSKFWDPKDFFKKFVLYKTGIQRKPFRTKQMYFYSIFGKCQRLITIEI